VHQQTAKLTVFAGFEMPLFYKGVLLEHLAVRNSVGIFDISHMGRMLIEGADSERFLNHVITNDISKLTANSAQYSVMCNENGGIIDDFVVYRLDDGKFMMVSNAANREKDYDWLAKNAESFNVQMKRISDDVAMLAVQGPNAQKTLQKICKDDLGGIERFKCASLHMAGDIAAFLSRTGYTGEDGFEIFIWNASLTRPDNAVKLWNGILEAGKPFGIEPCGLEARDTLRLEAGMCLYGDDIDENTTPLEAGLGFVVKLQKDNFVGKDALLRQKTEGIKRKRVGIRMIEQGIPRRGYDIYDNGENIGRLTSGTFSPLLKCGIGMGYVQAARAQEGNIASVKIRQRLAGAKIVSLPFYDSEKYGYKRNPTI
jgi:aminomethyltransferase